MTYQEIDLDNVENLGPFDRVNRIILGMTSIMLAVLFTAIPGTAIVVLTAVGMYSGLTAFIGWDPLYAMARAFQQQTASRDPTAVVAHQRFGEHTAAAGYKRAA